MQLSNLLPTDQNTFQAVHVDDARVQDIWVLHTLLAASATARSVGRLGATSTNPMMLSDKLEIILLCSGELYNSGHYIGCGIYDPRQCQYGQPNVGDEVHSLLLTLIECYRQLLTSILIVMCMYVCMYV